MATQFVPLELIDDNPYQRRDAYLNIDALGRTIAINGLEQQPKARGVSGRFQLKEGHRRKRAFLWLYENWHKEDLPERYSGYTVMPLDIVEATDREMFDGMVIENIYRDDLKPTETARLLKEYQKQFPDATSKDIGLVFGMNDATVRGTVRLLDLLPEVQEALDAGAITQGTARTFLSVQKIASKKAVVDTLKRVEKKQGKVLPEEVIEQAVDHLDNTVDLWDDSRDGKPRAKYNGWLLDMKNFPNGKLPVVDAGDIVHLLQLDKDSDEIKKIFAIFEQYVHEHAGENFRGISFEGLDVPAEHIEKLRVLVNPPACASCPFYAKIHGAHYCGMKMCYLRKERAWKTHVIEQASKNLGIRVYTEGDGRYVLLETHIEKHKKLFEKRDPGLRLISKEDCRDRYHYQGSYKGVDDDMFYVVATGGGLEKIATNGGKGGGGKLTEKEKAEMRAMKIYRGRRKDVMWEYTAVAQGMFAALSDGVLAKLRRWENILLDDRIPEDKEKSHESKGAEYQRRVLVWQLIMSLSSHYRRESLVKQLDAFQALVGVPAPKALVKQVATWDAEIDAAAKPVAVETPAKKGRKS